MGRTVLPSLQICTAETQTGKDAMLLGGCENRQALRRKASFLYGHSLTVVMSNSVGLDFL